jgi:hypothetical protein
MSDSTEKEQAITIAAGYNLDALQTLNAAQLAKALYKADLPESFIRSLPAQALYLAINANSLESSTEIIGIATAEQLQLLLDFDIWDKDSFSEERFWNWLAISDEDEDLRLLANIVRVTDLKIIALLIARYTDRKVFEEPTDNPPGPHYFTPDRGLTWIHIRLEETERYRLLGKLLAYLYETNPKVFYQLMAVPDVATATDLEEQAFQDKQRRLSDEGIPSPEESAAVNTPLSLTLARSRLAEPAHTEVSLKLKAIEPIVYQGRGLQPLTDFFNELGKQDATLRDELEAELSLLANAAFVRFGVNFADHDEIIGLIDFVKGTLNIGLELLMKEPNVDAHALYQAFHLRGIYQVGLHPILELHKAAKKLSQAELEKLVPEAVLFGIVAGAREFPPKKPNFLEASIETDSQGQLAPGWGRFDAHTQVKIAQELISKSAQSTLS